MKKWIFLLLFSIPVLILGGQLLYLYNHKEFKPNEFACSLVQEAAVEVDLSQNKEEIQKILNQPFAFLGLGKQMTAYESADHQYVLKFFNPRSRMKESWFHDIKKLKFFCTMKWFSHAYFKRKERLLKLFNRHAMAFKDMKEEAGLVYVHLNHFTALDQSVDIMDRDGLHYLVNLKDVPFVLQRKVELAGVHLAAVANDRGALNEAYDRVRELFTIRASKGITDRIQTLHNNYGFLPSGKAVQIDVGRISYSEAVQSDPQAEVERIMTNIR
ncbi:MAG: hypothetical protein KBA81_04440 [Rhabdochlamydiaceae bacterium]|nr:hypothetical protein [Rhabdochlamydiaceae bacterium]